MNLVCVQSLLCCVQKQRQGERKERVEERKRERERERERGGRRERERMRMCNAPKFVFFFGGGGDLVHTPSIGYNNDILISLMSVDLDLDHLEI